MHTKFWSVILNGRDFLEELGIDGRIVFKMVLTGIRQEGDQIP
jgi:hypothetical protein